MYFTFFKGRISAKTIFFLNVTVTYISRSKYMKKNIIHEYVKMNNFSLNFFLDCVNLLPSLVTCKVKTKVSASNLNIQNSCKNTSY
jgi:hypothetical protein